MHTPHKPNLLLFLDELALDYISSGHIYIDPIFYFKLIWNENQKSGKSKKEKIRLGKDCVP